MSCLIYHIPPKNFAVRFEVASCYCLWDEHLLLLQRHPRKSHANTWGVPAGKLEKSEIPVGAIKRELYEEIGVIVAESQLQFVDTLYIRQDGIDFLYHIFTLFFEIPPFIRLGMNEHQAYQWKTFPEAFKMPLMPGEDETLAFVQQAIKDR